MWKVVDTVGQKEGSSIFFKKKREKIGKLEQEKRKAHQSKMGTWSSWFLVLNNKILILLD